MAKIKRPDTYSEIQTDIGQRIKWARELVEPNRAEFARSLGVDRSTLQKIEDGSRAPSIFNILDICHILKVSPDYVLVGNLRGVDGEIAARLAVSHPELLSEAPAVAERHLTLVSPRVAGLLAMAREQIRTAPVSDQGSNTDAERPRSGTLAKTPGTAGRPKTPKER